VVRLVDRVVAQHGLAYDIPWRLYTCVGERALDVLVEPEHRLWHSHWRLPRCDLVWLDFWTVGHERSVDYMGWLLC